MIRLIQRRLIIPRGDTGSFTIPALNTVEPTDIAIFSIFDPLTHRKILHKYVTPIGQVLNIVFSHNETANLPTGKYVWDIKFYKNPVFDEEGEVIDGEEVNSYYAGFSLPVCEIRETAEDWPIYEWLKEFDIGDIVKNIASIVIEDGYLIIHFTDGTVYKTDSIRGEKGDPGTTFYPTVSPDGIISWTNNNNEINPVSVNLVEAVIAALPPSSGGLENIFIDTTENWNKKKTYVPNKGDIIIYSDKAQIIENDIIKNIPGIKIGDGNAYCIDLPFSTEDIEERLLNHINDNIRHITAQERQFWNNKLNVDISGEELQLNRN